MRRFPAFIAIFGIIALVAVAMRATAQEGPPGGPDGGDSGGPPRRNGLRGPGGGFHLIPPFAVEKLNLTKDQQKQVAELEKETKAKLYKILTPKQQKTLETSRPPRPGRSGGRRGPDGGPGRGGPGGDTGNYSGRFAAKAGAQPRLFGCLRGVEKAYVVASGPLGGAGWPAIDSRGRHAKDKLAVGGCVPAQHRLPASVGRGVGFRSILRHHIDPRMRRFWVGGCGA